LCYWTLYPNNNLILFYMTPKTSAFISGIDFNQRFHIFLNFELMKMKIFQFPRNLR
jgi:hypothetical protein